MEEKLIIISIDDEEVDSFIGTIGYVDEYCRNNYIDLCDILEFTAFAFVICNWK